ncbi:MAG: hypothetical protein KC478_03670 [Bacteriovoracaceae bacterium]|nr:hypothetical protein [Bacteriovoracaceae bacterium]
MRIKSLLALTMGLLFFSQTALATASVTFTSGEDYDQYSYISQDHKAIKDVFDRLVYKLTVEWDQNDYVIKAQIIEEFDNDMQGLAEQGISKDSIFKYVEGSILESSDKESFRNLLSTLKLQGISSEESIVNIIDYLGDSNMTGATFASSINGNGSTYALIAVIFVAVAYLNINRIEF